MEVVKTKSRMLTLMRDYIKKNKTEFKPVADQYRVHEAEALRAMNKDPHAAMVRRAQGVRKHCAGLVQYMITNYDLSRVAEPGNESTTVQSSAKVCIEDVFKVSNMARETCLNNHRRSKEKTVDMMPPLPPGPDETKRAVWDRSDVQARLLLAAYHDVDIVEVLDKAIEDKKQEDIFCI